MSLKMTAGEIADYLEEVFPQVDGQFTIEELGEMRVRVRLTWICSR